MIYGLFLGLSLIPLPFALYRKSHLLDESATQVQNLLQKSGEGLRITNRIKNKVDRELQPWFSLVICAITKPLLGNGNDNQTLITRFLVGSTSRKQKPAPLLYEKWICLKQRTVKVYQEGLSVRKLQHWSISSQLAF